MPNIMILAQGVLQIFCSQGEMPKSKYRSNFPEVDVASEKKKKYMCIVSTIYQKTSVVCGAEKNKSEKGNNSVKF